MSRNVSLVVPCLNENQSVDLLIGSVLRQTHKPNELIIVDGGSKDGTIELIKKWKYTLKKNGILLKIFSLPGSNISSARNYGIFKAAGEIIAFTDFGCILSDKWLEKISLPITNRTKQVVCGSYIVSGHSFIQKITRSYFGPEFIHFLKRFYLPSARSFATTKKFWDKKDVCFPDFLTNAGEDTYFNNVCLKNKNVIFCEPTAYVLWESPKKIIKVICKVRDYAFGDGESQFFLLPKILPHTKKILFLAARYFIYFLTLIFQTNLFPFIIFFMFVCNYFVLKRHYGTKEAVFFILLFTIIKLILDFLIVINFINGLISGSRYALRHSHSQKRS